MLGGVGGAVGDGDEQVLAPPRHGRRVPGDHLDRRQEVRRLPQSQAPLGVLGVEQSEGAGHVGPLHVAEPGGDVDDPVVGVPEVVDGDPLLGRDARHRFGLHRQDHDVLVPDVVALHVGMQRQRRGRLAGVEEHGRARHPVLFRRLLAQPLDELAQRPLAPPALGGDDLAAPPPGGHEGERGDADEQRQPGAVDQFRRVGGQEQQVHREHQGAPGGDQPHRPPPADAGEVEDATGRDRRTIPLPAPVRRCLRTRAPVGDGRPRPARRGEVFARRSPAARVPMRTC